VTPPEPPVETALDRALRPLVSVAPGEAGVVLRSAAIFFLVLSGYYVLRPVREEIGTSIGQEGLQWLFVVVFLAMLALVPAFGWIVETVARKRVLPLLYAFFIANLVAFWLVFSASDERPGPVAASVFFVWASVYNLFIVSLFWSLSSELYSVVQARRLYGFIAAGGSAGALVGPLLAKHLAARVSPNDLVLISAAFLALALIGALDLRRAFRALPAQGDRQEDVPAGSGGILAGLQRVLSSRYLTLIALYVLFANLIGTYFYLEQIRIVGEAIPERAARIDFFASRDLTVGVISILLQLFVTARMLQWFGVGVTLAMLPVAALIGLALLSQYPTLYVVAAVMVAERAISFALSNPALKVLYTVVTPDEKYKAQNFIDTVVYRGGDAASGWVFNTGAKAIGLAGASVAMLTLPAAAVWLVVAFALGRRHAGKAEAHISPLKTDA
jgi:AAA family ATP:ADP antiporter